MTVNYGERVYIFMTNFTRGISHIPLLPRMLCITVITTSAHVLFKKTKSQRQWQTLSYSHFQSQPHDRDSLCVRLFPLAEKSLYDSGPEDCHGGWEILSQHHSTTHYSHVCGNPGVSKSTLLPMCESIAESVMYMAHTLVSIVILEYTPSVHRKVHCKTACRVLPAAAL